MKRSLCLSCLFAFSLYGLYGLYGLLPQDALALTVESSQYRIEIINDKQSARPSNQNSFADQGYVLTEASAMAPFDANNFAKLTVSPKIVKLLIKRGSVANVNFQLENRGNPELISLEITELENNKPADTIQIQSESIQFDRPEAFLIDKALTKTNLQISIPKEIKEKDYYYQVVFEKNLEKKTVKTNRDQISSMLLITVSDNSQAEAAVYLEKLEVAQSWRNMIDAFSHVNGIIRLKNTGANFAQIQGQMIIQTMFGKKIIAGVKPTLILAHRSQIIDLPAKILPVGKQQMTISLNIKGAGLNQKDHLVSAKINFYVLPIKLVIMIIIALTIFILFMKLKKAK